jgi:hypothetical protein
MALALAGWLLLVATTFPALAQTQTIPAGSTVSVANTDGERLNLRAGPSTDQAVVTQLDAGTRLTVTGPSQTAGGTVWLPVRSAANQTGFVAAQYVQVVSTPTPTATRTPVAEPTPVPGSAASPASDGSMTPTPVAGRPLSLEAKLKFPETQGREQEITVWATRDGVPVPGVLITVETRDGDEEERFRELDPTNEEGRTRRSFDVRREKGTVELIVRAVAPDGGKGETTVTYFRH